MACPGFKTAQPFTSVLVSWFVVFQSHVIEHEDHGLQHPASLSSNVTFACQMKEKIFSLCRSASAMLKI